MALRKASSRLLSRRLFSTNVASSTHPDLIEDNKYILRTYERNPQVFVKGEGAYVWDTENKKYIDFCAGIAVSSLGHSHPALVKAINSTSIWHTSNYWANKPAIGLAKRLVENSPFDKAFLCNSGTEANEAAIKFSRKYAWKKVQPTKSEATSSTTSTPPAPVINKKTKIVSCTKAFHGRSLGALSTTYKEAYRTPFEPLIPGVTFIPFNDDRAAAEAITEDVCCVLVEPIQGEAGVFPATPSFLHTIRDRCTKVGALMVFDEVQCGLGRTGRLWAHTVYDVEADLMTLAKPLAGGLPIGAVLMKQNVADHINTGDHGTTFGGGPLAASVANAVFDIVNDPTFLLEVREKGETLLTELEKLKEKLDDEKSKVRIQEIRSAYDPSGRGGGLLVGVDFNIPVKEIVNHAASLGLLLITGGENTLRLCPPLVIRIEDIPIAVNKIEQAIKKLS